MKDITLRIPKGASVGIIGRNGSGKSTLLKLITGIYTPDTGKVSVNGKIAALIELGAGFHPDFTGRENLYLAGLMHGLSRKEIDKRFNDIVEFAELSHVIDEPVRTYSSGMFMRLGFSVAVHTDPELLIVDEVLAVGDAGFVNKCKAKIGELRKKGITLFLVSHDLDAVERWSDEVLWLHEGTIKDRGNPRRVIDHYREFLEKKEEDEIFTEEVKEKTIETETHTEEKAYERWGSREVEISDFKLLFQNVDHRVIHTGEPVEIEFKYLVREATSDIVFGVGVRRIDGLQIFGTNTKIDKAEYSKDLSQSGVVKYNIATLPLLPGRYYLDIAVHREDGYPYDYHQGVISFGVSSAKEQVGVASLMGVWSF